MFSREELQQGLQTHIFGRQIFAFDTIDSTNNYAKILASQENPEGIVVIADHQSAGRGRKGRVWIDEPGSNILLSLIIRPKIELRQVGLLPLFAALSVSLAVDTVTGLSSQCKWPNDVILNGKKCCGILLESAVHKEMLDFAIIGIGLNVNQIQFQHEYEIRATSLRRECGRELDRREIIRTLLLVMESYYQYIQMNDFRKIIDQWNTRDIILGKHISITEDNNEINGVARTIAPDGGLVVETSSGLRTVYSGVVTITYKA